MIARFEKMKGVQGATPVMNIYVKMMAGKYVGYVSILGIRADMFSSLTSP